MGFNVPPPEGLTATAQTRFKEKPNTKIMLANLAKKAGNTNSDQKKLMTLPIFTAHDGITQQENKNDSKLSMAHAGITQ